MTTDNARGVKWMLASAVCYTIMAVCLKLLALRHYPETQMVFVRCVGSLLLLLPVTLRGGPSVWASPRPWMMARRCLSSACGLTLAFYAFAHLPLATAQSLSFARTLFVVVLAVILLGERIGVWRTGATIIGFLGVLVMARPTELHVNLGTLAALGSAALMAYSVVAMKEMSKDHSALTLVLWMNAATAAIGLPFALLGWRAPPGADALLFALLALMGVLAQTCFTRGLYFGDASLMSLMDYARLPLAAAAGFLVFGEGLDEWSFAGAAIVIGATAFITVREMRLEKERAPPPPP